MGSCPREVEGLVLHGVRHTNLVGRLNRCNASAMSVGLRSTATCGTGHETKVEVVFQIGEARDTSEMEEACCFDGNRCLT